MFRFRFPKKILAVIVFLVIALMVIKMTGYERKSLTPFEIVLKEILAPLQSGVTQITRNITNISKSVLAYNDLLRENKELKNRILELTLENSRLEECRQENVRLKLLLDFKNEFENRWDMEAAKVIARNYGNWYHTITIDKGKNSGIDKDMAVVNYDGLVGRVINATPSTAEVLLILDSESAVGAMVQVTRVPGVVEAATEGEEKLQMIHIPFDAPLPKDGVVITSGLGGIFPKGLRIGYVKAIIPAPNGLVKKAMIRPFVDFDSLEEVLVIKRTHIDTYSYLERDEEGAIQ